MAHKTFGAPRPVEEAEKVEPITFDLGPATDLGCRTRVNGKLLLELMSRVESGNVGEQAKGILSIFNLVMLRDDGEDPEGYTGKAFDPTKPLEHHTQAELETAQEEDITPGIDPTSSLGRVNEVLDDPDTEIEITDLAELVGWIMEQLTARPTSKSGGSRSGTGNTKRTSGRVRQPRAALTSVESSSE